MAICRQTNYSTRNFISKEDLGELFLTKPMIQCVWNNEQKRSSSNHTKI